MHHSWILNVDQSSMVLFDMVQLFAPSLGTNNVKRDVYTSFS